MYRSLLAPAMLALLLAPLALAPSGCIQGGDASPEPASADEDLTAVNQLSQEDRIFFLKRTHFAFRVSELQRLNQLGYEAYLDWMLDLSETPALDAAALNATVVDPDFPSELEIARWWTYLMTYTENPFQEMLAMFWHDHFATSTEVLDAQQRYWMFDHINLWRHHGADHLDDLLYDMSTDWAMLVWLDGIVSTANAPNENFAREFWELFTLGVDNGYTEADIQEASRAFTGYRNILVPNKAGPGRDQRVIEFQSNRHDNGTKSIFGLTVGGNGQQEYRDMVNFTLANRPVAEFICRKIWEHFVYADPSDELVASLANGLRKSGYDLKALFKRIFMSKAFFGTRARDGVIKSPVEHHIGFMRATGLYVTPSRADFSLNDTGQRPSMPPTVNGWPSGDFWLSSQALVERANFLRDCVYYRNEAPQSGYDVGMELIPPNMRSASGVVEQLAFLMQVQLTAAQRAECLDYLNTDQNSSGVFADPFDFGNPDDRDKKVRGLLYILGQHPSYQIK